MIRKDVPIYYRNLYTGVAVVELTNSQAEYRIDFAIENKPTGQKEISVSFVDKPDYPLVPLTKELKNCIDNLDASGGLPD
jgi:2-methylaconitate cis-trans-isomerase PrpF